MSTLKTDAEEEEILTFNISDEALEIAGSDKTNFTWGGLHSGSGRVSGLRLAYSKAFGAWRLDAISMASASALSK